MNLQNASRAGPRQGMDLHPRPRVYKTLPGPAQCRDLHKVQSRNVYGGFAPGRGLHVSPQSTNAHEGPAPCHSFRESLESTNPSRGSTPMPGPPRESPQSTNTSGGPTPGQDLHAIPQSSNGYGGPLLAVTSLLVLNANLSGGPAVGLDFHGNPQSTKPSGGPALGTDPHVSLQSTKRFWRAHSRSGDVASVHSCVCFLGCDHTFHPTAHKDYMQKNRKYESDIEVRDLALLWDPERAERALGCG